MVKQEKKEYTKSEMELIKKYESNRKKKFRNIKSKI